ncbi:MAG: DUF1456 family protein [Lysobacterales bacterium]
MNNNDVLRRIRYTFNFDDTKMIDLFGLGGVGVTRTEVSNWLKRDDDPDYRKCGDVQLAAFLNGLIVEKRGKKDGPQPAPETSLSNNIVLRKLKIALNLQSDDVQALIKQADFSLSNHELSAFFRKPGHKHYRECKDQVLRYFLKGVQHKYRG